MTETYVTVLRLTIIKVLFKLLFSLFLFQAHFVHCNGVEAQLCLEALGHVPTTVVML